MIVTRKMAFAIPSFFVSAALQVESATLEFEQGKFVSASFEKWAQDAGTVTVQERSTVTLHNNAWKAYPIDYKIGPSSVLKFEFKTDQYAEFIGIALSDGTKVGRRKEGPAGDVITITHGEHVRPETKHFDSYPISKKPGWVSYEVDLGHDVYEHFQATHLVLIRDADKKWVRGTAQFRNIELTEHQDVIAKDLVVREHAWVQNSPVVTEASLKNMKLLSSEPGVGQQFGGILNGGVFNAIGTEEPQNPSAIFGSYNDITAFTPVFHGNDVNDLRFSVDRSKWTSRGSDSTLVLGNNNSLGGDRSMVIGRNNITNGSMSLVAGLRNYNANGDMVGIFGYDNRLVRTAYSVVCGEHHKVGSIPLTTPPADTRSVAVFGAYNRVTGSRGLTAGFGLENDHDHQTIVGISNDPDAPEVNGASKPVFVIGNGAASENGEKSNALIVLENGDIIIPKVQGDISMGIFGNE